MAKRAQREFDPVKYDLSRRRFLRYAGIGAASLPFLGSLAEPVEAASSIATKNPWPSYPPYKFAFVCHVTADVFFNAVRAGATDISTLLGTSYTWTGSENDIIPEMVNAFNVAINNKVDGIACAIVDPKAFNSVTNAALDKGIPVVAYNAQAPAGAGNNALSYIGQDLFKAGVAVGQKIATYVKKGDLVGCMTSVIGSLNEQPRWDGAKSVLVPAGIDAVQVGVGATEGPALTSIQAWYQGHKEVKWMFSTGGSNGVAVAKTIQKLGLASKGVGGSAFDVGLPVLQNIAAGNLAFTVDQQAYQQGWMSIYQLFLYNITGGLITPTDYNTGFKYVTKDTVGSYLQNKDTWEGSSSSPVVFTRPSKIAHS
jgi:simple sugar transport system substrate-binding protein